MASEIQPRWVMGDGDIMSFLLRRDAVSPVSRLVEAAVAMPVSRGADVSSFICCRSSRQQQNHHNQS
jgi:hypothetical protein